MYETPSFKEDHISQIPALQLLQQLGWEYVTPAEADELRGGKRSSVILDGILVPHLRTFNKIRFKGAEHEFSEANLQTALVALRDILLDGLVRTNEKIVCPMTSTNAAAAMPRPIAPSGPVPDSCAYRPAVMPTKSGNA